MSQSNINSIWVIAEQTSGLLTEVTVELISQARHLAEEANSTVAAVLLGYNVASLADLLVSYGADRVYFLDDHRLDKFNPEVYAGVLERILVREKPDVALWGATVTGSELAPTLAARLETGLAAHCTDLYWDARGNLVMVVPAFGGKVLGEIFCFDCRPVMASVKTGIFTSPLTDEHVGQVIREDASILEGIKQHFEIIEQVAEKPAGLPLEKAKVVVAGGWGMGSKENWGLLDELAGILGGCVGCTRPALDEGWTAGEHTMIGTSGKNIRPGLYIGAGISGAAHHMVGIKDAGVIIAVNNDPKAPIFQYADYGVVADLNEILHPLITALKEP